MRVLRILLTYMVFWVLLPFLVFHPKLRHGFWQRLGRHKSGWPKLNGKTRIWIHGASAGDILALRPLAHELKTLVPGLEVVASTITNSGYAMAQKSRDAFAAITYMPWDLPGSVRRSLERVRPQVLVLEYTELWPEFVHAAHALGIRVVLHNGRFSAERLKSYRLMFRALGNLLRKFDLLLMRDEYEGERALRLGAPESRVHITGNTKFDNLAVTVPEAKVEELRRALGFPEGAPLWVAGSTHEGEEEALIDVYARLKENHPELRMVIAPRYTERSERVLHLAERRGFAARLRKSAQAPADIVVLDTIGELAACYQLATLVFVGGSFVTRGGQNILEPAACGKPVLFGPHMQNFTDAVLVLLGRGGIQVASPEQLLRVMADLLQQSAYRQELGNLARQQVLSVRGAARRNAELIAKLLA